MKNRDEIVHEVNRALDGNEKRGVREHMLAYLLFTNGLAVDVRFPDCDSLLSVEPFPTGNEHSINCDCGTCTGRLWGV